MANFVSSLWKELVWVVSPNKAAGVKVPSGFYWHLLYPFPLAVGMLSIRYVLTRYCFIPLGQYLGVKDSNHKNTPTPNPLLETVYIRQKQMSRSQILGVAKQLDMTERQVERWLRLRKKQDKTSTLTKFCECCWRFTYYSTLFTYGLVVLWDKPWFWDITKCWEDFPDNFKMSNDVWWYYMISLSFYWSLFFGQFFIDVKRKDFWQMFVHHVVTIFLMSFSWLAGTYKVGTLVLVVHDCGDIFLEAAKIAKYADFQATCTVIFGIFTVVWIITRLGIFPLWIIRHSAWDSLTEQPDFPAYCTFNSMLILLLGLHCFWTYLIVKIVFKAIWAGQVEGDVRSSSEEKEHSLDDS